MSGKLGVGAALCLPSALALGTGRIAIKPGLLEVAPASESAGAPATPGAVQGSVTMHRSDGTRAMVHRTQVTGTWLGAGCCPVTPRA
jgi:hypothetical protein